VKVTWKAGFWSKPLSQENWFACVKLSWSPTVAVAPWLASTP
jgi:hypothetical protein